MLSKYQSRLLEVVLDLNFYKIKQILQKFVNIYGDKDYPLLLKHN